MAGKGPAPAEQKRRRNKEHFEELPAEGYEGPFPELPDTYRIESTVWVEDPEDPDGPKVPELHVAQIEFLPATREWYETWARSPMATEFTGVDWQRLARVARLVDRYERGPSKDLLAEIRLQEAGFGGTPMDRRRLGRKITGQDPVSATRSRAKKKDTRRARLSVVK